MTDRPPPVVPKDLSLSAKRKRGSRSLDPPPSFLTFSLYVGSAVEEQPDEAAPIGESIAAVRIRHLEAQT